MATYSEIRQYIERNDNTTMPDIRNIPVRELKCARIVKKQTGITMPTNTPPIPRVNIPALRARLCEARKRAGMTYEDVQRAIGMNAQRVKYIETNDVRTTTRVVQQFASLYGVSVEWLCYGTEEDNGR